MLITYMSSIFLKRHSIIRHASYMSRIFLKRHSIIRHASYMSSIFLKRHSIIRHASYMSSIFLKRHSIIRHASYMSRIFLKRHSIIRHASYMSSIFLKRHSFIRLASVVITSCCDFYQEKQRGRNRAPVLSSEDYTIVITALNSHSPDSSHNEKLLYRKVEAFIHRQNMSLILFTCVLCRYIY